MTVRVEAPRLNANEDQLQIVQVLVEDGTEVAADQLLFVAETTKATHEIFAPTAGHIVGLTIRAGAMVEVGSVLCLIDDADRGAAQGLLDGEPSHSTVKVILKARQRAAELGIQLDAVPALAGRITVEQVEAHARDAGLFGPTPPRPVSTRAPAHGEHALVYGAGGHATIILDLLGRTGYEIVGCLADDGPSDREIVPGVRQLGGELLERLFAQGVRTAFVGIGGIESNEPRRRIFDRLLSIGFHLPPLVSSTAHIGIGARLGPATVVCPGAIVGPCVAIGANCIINAGAVVSHHSTVGDHCHITPGALIAGECHVGSGSTIGMGATLLNRAIVGANCLIDNNANIAGKVLDGTEVTAKGIRLKRQSLRVSVDRYAILDQAHSR